MPGNDTSKPSGQAGAPLRQPPTGVKKRTTPRVALGSGGRRIHGRGLMMPPRYVVHVGPMKTASTYLQHCFTSVQDEFRERGIYYAPELIDPGNKHMHMPVYKGIVAEKGETLRPVFATINQAGYKTVVLSCEHLIFLRRNELALLCDVIGVPDIEIVYVIRRWSDRIGSMWTQTLYMGGSQTLPEYYLKMLDARAPDESVKRSRRSDSFDMDYSLAWHEIVSVVGRRALKLFPSSAIMDQKADLFTRFCSDILGLDDVPVPKALGEKRWASMERDDAEILRTLNAMYFREHGETTTKIRKLMLSRRYKADDALIRDAIENDMAELTIDDRAAYFDAPYANMTAYADLLVPGSGVAPGEIFPRRSRKQGYARQAWLMEPGVAESVRALYSTVIEASKKLKLRDREDDD